MCLYPRLIRNPKYKENQKNGGVVPPVSDTRTLYVPIGCGTCLECRKQNARNWQVRLCEDIKEHTNGKFMTLTFSTESLKKLLNENEYISKLKGYDVDNALATRAVRLFLERWRKKFGKSLRHWFVTELGHKNTEHIHIHGIVWTDCIEELPSIWQYGFCWIGYNTKGRLENYVSSRTVNYIVKYVSKMDFVHMNYKPMILTSAGIGRRYATRGDIIVNRYNGKKTIETYRTESGHKVSLPIYYRNKVYSDKERELLWLQKLDKQERWVCGEKVSIRESEEFYYILLKYHQERTFRLGYPAPDWTWQRKQYENERRDIIRKARLEKV